MYKKFVSIAFCALLSTTGFSTPPANAMTGEEFLKLMGVLGRYSDDIQRTFSPNNQPNVSPQTNRNSQPNRPQPNEPNDDDEPETDPSLEQ